MCDNFPPWPVKASGHALPVDLLYIFLVVLSLGTTLAIFVGIALFSMKYRRRHGREATPIEGSLILEISWSVIPLGIFMSIFLLGAVISCVEPTPPQPETRL